VLRYLPALVLLGCATVKPASEASFSCRRNFCTTDRLQVAAPEVPRVDVGEINVLTGLKIAEALRQAPEGSEVALDIDSPGGSVGVGLGILDVMKDAKARGITISCRVGSGAMAASMAGIIFVVGCSTREMAPDAMLLFHEPAMGFEGGKEWEFRRAANHLADVNQRMAILVAAHLKHPDGSRWSATEYRAWIHERDRWASADEALAMGATDAVK
jgi:ATP-dependent protease ClpP protease subunit